jgi:hypothetical protein
MAILRSLRQEQCERTIRNAPSAGKSSVPSQDQRRRIDIVLYIEQRVEKPLRRLIVPWAVTLDKMTLYCNIRGTHFNSAAELCDVDTSHRSVVSHPFPLPGEEVVA